MAKEIDQTYYIGNPRCVDFTDGKGLDCLLKSKEQRRTYGYYLIPEDALLDRC